MMKVTGYYINISCKLFLGILAIFVASCNTEIKSELCLQLPENYYGSFYSDETKMILDENNNQVWEKNDKISVFRSDINEGFSFDGNTGDDEGTFSKVDGNISQTIYHCTYAVYPYNPMWTSTSEGVINASIQATQYYQRNTFDRNSNIMVAKTKTISDSKLRFGNVCGYLRLNIYGGNSIKSIRLFGNDNEDIAGRCKIVFTPEGEETVILDGDSNKNITLDCGSGVSTMANSLSPTSFIFVLPPITFCQGISIEVEDVSGKVVKAKTNDEFSIKKNCITTMKNILLDNNSGTTFLSFTLSNGITQYQTIGINDKNIWVYVPYGESKKNLCATFETNSLSVVVEGVPQISGITENDFSSAVEYVLSSASGIQKRYQVNAFSSELPVVSIVTSSPVKDKVNWINASIQIRNSNGEIDYSGEMLIRGRGNQSWSYPKKPYAIKLLAKAKLLGMPKHKRWCLLANYVDRTLVRNEMSFEIGRRCDSLKWTPKGRFVDVVLNGEFIGNYYLVEQIRVDKNRVDINEIITPDDITGGYLMEMDCYYNEINKFRSKRFNLPYQFKSPDDENLTDEEFSYMQEYVNHIEELLMDEDSLAAHKYADYLDVFSFADYWIAVEMTTLYEPNNPYSCWVYKDKGGKLKAGPLWDFEYSTYRAQNYYLYIIKNALYYKQLFKDPFFVQIVKQRWSEIKPRLTTNPSIVDHLDSLYHYLGPSIERDELLWPKSTSYNYDEDYSIEDAFFKMREYIIRRIDWLDTNIPKL